MNAVTEGRKVLLEIADLKVHFEIKDGKQWFWQPPKTLKAVDGVTLRLYEGETLGVVGESGCGKSTFAITRLSASSPSRARELPGVTFSDDKYAVVQR
ncbi:hypothetical protein AYO07_22590 [Escherichia coli]|nr:hypothetical protein AYO07_22590 [Escherichia coli]